VVLISTGSQGEPLSALSRIAQRNHNFVHIEEGDTVVLASSLIPGNENAVYRVINGLARYGAHVVHRGNALVHVSGHASAGELLYCYNVVRPRNVLPVHGEIRHMLANAALARATGIPADRVVIAEDGVVVDLLDGVASVAGKVECGYVFVDGSSVGDLTESSLKDRRILGEEGFISVIVVIDSQTGKVVSGPEIHARGFAEEDATFDAATDHPPRRRPLGQRHASSPADDHPRGARGLATSARPHALCPRRPAGAVCPVG
jgi:ribonuclease J